MQPVASSGSGAALDEGQLGNAPKTDRLPPMLFLAALIHGILIIGITFNAFVDDVYSRAVSLEVTIVADPEYSFDREDSAEYLAQASQEGGGNTQETARPSAPASSSVPVDNIGALDAHDLVDATENTASADQLLATRSEQERRIRDDRRDDPQNASMRAAELQAGVQTTLPLPQDDRANFLVRDQNRERILISADTRESSIAGYVDSWKRKIETIGSKYIPEQGGLAGLTGSPTLEVTIDASGQLAEVIIVKSSGSRTLDQAALDILRRAAPFDPFPEAVRVDYPQLNFLYKWQFNEPDVQSTAQAN